MKDINNKELSDKDLEQVNGGQVKESVILAHEKAKEEKMKVEAIILAGRVQLVTVEVGKEAQK